MKRNSRIKELFENVRILPVRERGRGESIFAAYSAAVASLGYGENEIFGIQEIPENPAKKGRA